FLLFFLTFPRSAFAPLFPYTTLFRSAILIIYLVLAAQFESFRDPLIVMMSVPMAIFGAMLFIFEGAASLNIYTEVGLVTLVGLRSEEHTSELQSRENLVCRLLLEKKK